MAPAVVEAVHVAAAVAHRAAAVAVVDRTAVVVDRTAVVAAPTAAARTATKLVIAKARFFPVAGLLFCYVRFAF
jgi:hypothetical protein